MHSLDCFELADAMMKKFRPDDPVIQAHHEANSCVACEKTLENGLSTLKWLDTCRDALRLIYVQDIDIKGVDVVELGKYLNQLYREWLEMCERVDELIKRFHPRYEIKDLDAYRKAKRKVEQQLRVMQLAEFDQTAYEPDFFSGAFDGPVSSN